MQAYSDRSNAVRQANRTASEYTAAANDAADAGGMPQLDFGNPLTIAQVVWLFVIFGLLVFIAGVALVMAGSAGRWSAAWPWPLLALPAVLAVALLPLSPTLTALGLALVLVATVVAGTWQQQHGHIATTET